MNTNTIQIVNDISNTKNILNIINPLNNYELKQLRKKATSCPTFYKAIDQLIETRKKKSVQQIFEVAGDGECLFNSVAFGILYYLGNRNVPTKQEYKQLAKRLREETVAMLQKDFNNAISKQKNGKVTEATTIMSIMTSKNTYRISTNFKQSKANAKTYINKMKKSSTWGTQLEVQKLSTYVREFGFNGIKVLQKNENQISQIHGMNFTNSKYKSEFPTIQIILHGVNVGGIHFDFMGD